MHRVGGRQFTSPQLVDTQETPGVMGHAPAQNTSPMPGLLPAEQVHPAESGRAPHVPVPVVAPPSRVVRLHMPGAVVTTHRPVEEAAHRPSLVSAKPAAQVQVPAWHWPASADIAGSALHVSSCPTVQGVGVRAAAQRPVAGLREKPGLHTHWPNTHVPARPPMPPSTGPSLHDMATRSVQTLPGGWQRPAGDGSKPWAQKHRPPAHSPAKLLMTRTSLQAWSSPVPVQRGAPPSSGDGRQRPVAGFSSAPAPQRHWPAGVHRPIATVTPGVSLQLDGWPAAQTGGGRQADTVQLVASANRGGHWPPTRGACTALEQVSAKPHSA